MSSSSNEVDGLLDILQERELKRRSLLQRAKPRKNIKTSFLKGLGVFSVLGQ